MATPPIWRALTVLLVLGGAAALVATRPARLGLDLRGGTQIVLEAKDTPTVAVTGDVASRTLEVLRRRVDALGVAEPTLQRSGERRVIVELPGVTDPAEAVEVIGRTAQLSFHHVLEVLPPASMDIPTTGAGQADLILTGEQGERLRLGPPPVTGEAVGDARAALSQTLASPWQVEVDFRPGGEQGWAALTGEAACTPPLDPKRRIAIVLDRDILSAPEVASQVVCGQGIQGSTTVITGRFSEDEAKELALLIRAGALPVPVRSLNNAPSDPPWGLRRYGRASKRRSSARRSPSCTSWAITGCSAAWRRSRCLPTG